MSSSDLTVTMYESDPMVAALNKVPGFDPLKLMGRKRIPGAEKDEKSLDFRYKKLWFRLAHRTGRIRLNRLSITEQLAIIEAQVYLELTDANPVSSFTAACTREEGGDKYIESAQIRAMDQALTDAGFGLQFVPAPVGSMENTAPQAAGPVVNMQMPKVPQPVMQQVQQAAPQQAGVLKKAVAAQAVPQQKTAAVQSAPQQQTVSQQAGVQQKTVAAQAAHQPAVAQQRMAAAQTTSHQRAVPQQAAPQQCTTAQQSAVQQQTAVSQQRIVAQQAAVQPQAVRQSTAPQAAVPNKSAQTAQVQVQTVQAGQKGVSVPAQAGMQTAAISPAAPAASQKAAVPVSTLQTAAQQPVNAETLPVGQPPITTEARELPVTSDIAAAMSLLSGNKEDTLPVAPAGMKAGEKAEYMPQELPVAPAASTVAVSSTSNTAAPTAPVSEMPAAPAPAANTGGAADEGRPYTEETPVEEILQFMTLEDAKKVVVSAGTCRGQTIAEVAQYRPFSLKFYLSEAYQGRDNILRAAARLMLDNMEKKAG